MLTLEVIGLDKMKLPSTFKVEFNGNFYPCYFIEDKSKAEKLLTQLNSKTTMLAADTETAALSQYKHIPMAALSPHLADIRLLQVFTGTGAAVIDLHKTGPIDLKTLFENRPSVFHNMTFDYKMLNKHYGVQNPDMHCTCIMAKCVFHAVYPDKKSASLQNVIITLFGEEISKKAGASDWSTPTLTFEQVKYAALDAIVQMAVYEKLNDLIDKLKLRRVYELYRKAQLAVCDMELNGVLMDKKKHMENVVKWRQEQLDARDEVLELTKLDSITDAKLGAWLEKNLEPDILAIWPRTETGKLQTDAHTFVDFSYLGIVKPFSKYQKLKKLTTSFGTKMVEAINPATGRIHSSYNVAGAKTGRLSCSNVNFQQMPRSEDMRSVFIATPGYEMVVADYSQVEVRCIAEFSNDARMLTAYEEGLDIYAYTAAQINNKPISEVTKVERQSSKCLQLGLAYGLGPGGFSHYSKKGYGVDITPEESVALVGKFREVYNDLRQWQLDQVELCKARKFMAFTKLGKSRKMTEEDYYGACMNHPIQGTCAEIMLLALVYVRESFKGTSARLLACVHDEIVAECLPEDLEKTKNILKTDMVKAYLKLLPSGRTVKGLVDPSSGSNWAEAK